MGVTYLLDVTFDTDDVTLLRQLLTQREVQIGAWAKALHTTDAERAAGERELAGIARLKLALSTGNTYPQENQS